MVTVVTTINLRSGEEAEWDVPIQAGCTPPVSGRAGLRPAPHLGRRELHPREGRDLEESRGLGGVALRPSLSPRESHTARSGGGTQPVGLVPDGGRRPRRAPGLNPRDCRDRDIGHPPVGTSR
jgi:hypothetical protein